MLIAEM